MSARREDGHVRRLVEEETHLQSRCYVTNIFSEPKQHSLALGAPPSADRLVGDTDSEAGLPRRLVFSVICPYSGCAQYTQVRFRVSMS